MAETAGERRSLKLARDRPFACPSATPGLFRLRVSQSPTSGALSVNGGSGADEVPEARFASRREQQSVASAARLFAAAEEDMRSVSLPSEGRPSPALRRRTHPAPASCTARRPSSKNRCCAEEKVGAWKL